MRRIHGGAEGSARRSNSEAAAACRKRPKRDLGAVLTRVWLRSVVRDVTNPNTGSVRAHGEQRQRTTARRRSNTPVSKIAHAGSREQLDPSGTRSRARGKHGRAYQGRDAGGGAVQGRWRRAPAATLGAEIVGRSLRWSSGLLGSKDRFVKVLRGSHGGQQARSRTRGMELRRRTGSPPAASGANPMA